MNFVIIAFAAALAVANAGLLGHGHSTVLQGPSSKTTLIGPDGSHISGHAPGGQVATTIDVGYAAHTGHIAPVIAHAAPYVGHASPYVGHAAPYVAHAVPYVAHAAPAVAHSSILRVDQIHSSPVIAHAAPVFAHGVLGHAEGLGLEGQYLHDYTETLYDDGSYKGEHYHH